MTQIRRENAQQHRTRLNRRPGECTWCGRQVTGRKVSWCSKACVEAFRQVNDPEHIRRLIYRRDHGVCRCCGFDTDKLLRILWWSITSNSLPRARSPKTLLRKLRWQHLGDIHIHELSQQLFGCSLRRVPWEADHIVPVVEGGGQQGLSSYRTLCLLCHKIRTRRLARRLAQQRRS